jgi:hypothetical protein
LAGAAGGGWRREFNIKFISSDIGSDLPLPRRGVLSGKSFAHKPPLAAVFGRACGEYRSLRQDFLFKGVSMTASSENRAVDGGVIHFIQFRNGWHICLSGPEGAKTGAEKLRNANPKRLNVLTAIQACFGAGIL